MAAPERRSRRTLIGVGLVVLAVLVGVVGISPLFALREVRVEGTGILTTEQVVEVAEAPMGRPLVRVSEREIAERVAVLPPAAEVHVSRGLPDVVTIQVVEREPVFVLDAPSGPTLVDAEGFAFAEARDAAGLVTATAPADPETLRGIAAVLRETGDLRVDRVEAHSPDSITLFLPEDRRVVVGSGEDAALKMKVARALLDATDARFIDVTAPGNPSTR